jgi:hypothetical protein
MRLWVAAAAAVLAVPSAEAQGLAAYATPPRFEVKGEAGKTERHVLEIQHGGREPGRFRIYTNDWEFQPDFSVKFSDALSPSSCRPWVALERRELTLQPGAKHRFRFEVTPPPGTPPTECRFAVMIEGAEPAQVQQGGLGVAVSGRLAVIVYVAVGGVKPKLAVRAHAVKTVGGERLPVLTIENTGEATGRLEGFLTAKDDAGKQLELAPDDSPILPGRTRDIPLRAGSEEGKAPPAIKFPVSVKGTLEWDKQREALDLRFGP